MKGGGFDAHEKEAFKTFVQAQFSARRESKVPQFRHCNAWRLPYIVGGRNERVTSKRGPAETPGLFY